MRYIYIYNCICTSLGNINSINLFPFSSPLFYKAKFLQTKATCSKISSIFNETLPTWGYVLSHWKICGSISPLQSKLKFLTCVDLTFTFCSSHFPPPSCLSFARKPCLAYLHVKKLGASCGEVPGQHWIPFNSHFLPDSHHWINHVFHALFMTT